MKELGKLSPASVCTAGKCQSSYHSWFSPSTQLTGASADLLKHPFPRCQLCEKINLLTPLPSLMPGMENHVYKELLSFIHSPTHSFIHSLIHSFSKYVLSTYFLPGTVFGAGDTLVKKMDKVLVLTELIFCGGRHTINMINK